MENLTKDDLNVILAAMYVMLSFRNLNEPTPLTDALVDKIKQAIADKEFEEKTRPLNF